ncbi:hypothetical protein TSOC_012377 [Tetrabaena socialis]|uniref:Uncharacterized protein n=1 Tax=Tetrabaena socialis TaxID=47790 RepID=A0A2J7ZN91_9CHLO|nr:hypothetical protein TSOC_012377 [Tetrabaena socialis]|eukprot:PNH01726.1 hypothetical protein TSOC_012377 [Tetrabaena socialis]
MLGEAEDEEFWVESSNGPMAVVAAGSVRRMLECEFSQRQDRDGNPHGEHAHDVYRLLQPPSPGVYRGPRVVMVVQGGEGGGSGGTGS